jgi:hypothetical protein
MKYRFYVPSLNETIADAVDVYHVRFDYTKGELGEDYDYSATEDVESVAEDAAEILYDALSHEWNDGTHTIVIVSADGKEEAFDVKIEYQPTFNAVKK